jgi:uncharacterized glyoxalase superfamily protein PhnB
MSVSTTPHLNFRGQAREALEFYRSVFGGDLSIATYSDIHAVEEPGQAARPQRGKAGRADVGISGSAVQGLDPGLLVHA